MEQFLDHSFWGKNGDRQNALTQIIFAFENDDIPLSRKDTVLAKLSSLIDYHSSDEVASFVFAVGKYSSPYSVKVLLSLTHKIINDAIAWQYLVAYENIVGNSILLEFSVAFDIIRSFTDKVYFESDKIKQALQRFKDYEQ
ncbi:MAG: hypothetical protein J6U05_08010 [Neisseriaceae bacterium]|nr:hypothetical protein [Neisseriaceae bacterium]